MNETIASTGEALNIQIIDLYGQLLLDKNLIFAIILAWAVTHFMKQSPMIRMIKPIEKRRFVIRVMTVVVGFWAVIFFKRNQIPANPDQVINFAVMVAFIHPVLYKVMTAVLDRVAPEISANLKTRRGR